MVKNEIKYAEHITEFHSDILLKKPKSAKPRILRRKKRIGFKCQKCQSEFKEEDNYKSHLVTHIKSVKRRIALTLKDFSVSQIESMVHCDKCENNDFENIEAYDEHIKKAHLQDTKLLQTPRVELERLSEKSITVYTKPIPDSQSGHWFSGFGQESTTETNDEIMDIETSDLESGQMVSEKVK